MAERTIVQLTEPVQHGSETITELKFRPPKLGDLRGISLKVKGDEFELSGDLVLHFVEKCAGIPAPVADEISLADLGTIGKVVMGFIEASLGVGAAAS